MNDSTDFPASIRARVHDGAIDRVTRFFAATLAEAFAELIQNARRGGARGLAVVTEAIPAGGIRVTVTDDGRGIADPAVLLSFGESGWDAETAEREDPAGIGVYALSKRGCSVSSRPRIAIGEHAPGWRVVLTPDCFLGKEDATLFADDNAPWPHGTAISFMADETLEAIQAALSGVGEPFVWAICEGADSDPWNGPVSALPIPDKFAERGAPPVVTLTGPRPPGRIDVTGGTVRFRFVEDAGTVTTEISDPPPPPGNKPLVTVRRRADGAPDTEVRGGKAIIRVEGWDAPDEVVQPG